MQFLLYMYLGQFRGWGRRQGGTEPLQGYSGYGQYLPPSVGSTEQTFPEKIPSVHEISVCVCLYVCMNMCVYISDAHA